MEEGKIVSVQIGSEVREYPAGISYEEVAKDYIELRRCEYKYLEVLTNYVPLLLEKEKFFRSTFK